MARARATDVSSRWETAKEMAEARWKQLAEATERAMAAARSLRLLVRARARERATATVTATATATALATTAMVTAIAMGFPT